MAATKLIPYTVQIHPRGNPGDEHVWDLSELQEHGGSVQSQLGTAEDPRRPIDADTFTDLVGKFCQEYEGALDDLGESVEQLGNVTLGISSDWESSDNVVEGNLYLGNYGVVRNLVNRKTGERREHGRDIDDSEEKPLYFLIYTPSRNATEAYLLLERSRRYGAKQPFHASLRRWIRERYDDQVVVEAERVKTEEIFPVLRSADRTVRLRFEKEGSPERIHSRFGDVFHHQEMNEAVEYRPPDDGDLGLIVDELEDWYRESETAFETINGTTYDNVKITIEKNDSKETISLTKGEANMRKNIDLSDIAAEGDIPVLSKMSSKAHSFLRAVTGEDTGTRSLFNDQP